MKYIAIAFILGCGIGHAQQPGAVPGGEGAKAAGRVEAHKPAKKKTAKGTVVSVDPQNGIITVALKKGKKSMMFLVTAGTKVRRGWGKAALADIDPEEKVKVTYRPDGVLPEAIKVKLKKKKSSVRKQRLSPKAKPMDKPMENY